MEFDPDADIESWRLAVPAKPACYLLVDEADRPVLLATAGDLRGALVRRLGRPQTDEGPVRRIDYRQVVRRVRYRQVGGSFEANWAYLENARRFFGPQHRQMTRRFKCHWICLESDSPAPRWVIASQPAAEPADCFGPFDRMRDARDVIQGLEDLFDLCREYSILQQTPHGTACAYKEMGRCPAPCDGTVSMDAYRRQLQESAAFLTDPDAAVGRATERMARAAERREYEKAAELKKWLDRAEALRPLPRSVDCFDYLGIHPGATDTWRTLFRVRAGLIERIGQFQRGQPLAEAVASLACRPALPLVLQEPAARRMGLVADDMRRPGAVGRWFEAERLEDPDRLLESIERATQAEDRSGGNVNVLSSVEPSDES
ncbi:MAG: hypothetical protein R3236_04745 [Phycisphaeraceae bacterium]|nr:hypothetical protein [Phycisphaeraceae bacterium]